MAECRRAGSTIPTVCLFSAFGIPRDRRAGPVSGFAGLACAGWEACLPKPRVHNFALSLDGYAAGPNQSLDNPLGVGGARLHERATATGSWRRMQGMSGGEEGGVDDEFIARGERGSGATIMGRNFSPFGPIRGPWADEDWKGWGATTRPTTTRCSR